MQEQEHGGWFKPVVYYSRKVDAVACSLPACLTAVVVAVEAVLMLSDLVQMHPFQVHASHAVHAILSQMKTSHLTAAQLAHYQNVPLTLANVTIE